MRKTSLPHRPLPGITSAWAHPYGHGPFSPVLYADGGDGAGDGSGSTGGADAGQTAATGTGDGQQAAGTGVGTQQQAAGQGAGTGGDSGTDLAATVARLERELTAARREAGAARVNAKTAAAEEAKAELAQQIGKALGFVKDDGPPDPAKLAEAITAKDSRISELEASLRAQQVEAAVRAAADKQQAKPNALLDSRAFSKVLAGLDPAATDFTTQLDDAIKKAVADNSSFRIAPQAGRSGADLTSGTGETSKTRPTSLNAALRGLYST
jgi:hypothetical protein